MGGSLVTWARLSMVQSWITQVMEEPKVVGHYQELGDNTNNPGGGCATRRDTMVRWQCCRVNYSAASCPSRWSDHPMWFWVWAAVWVERLANREREDCAMQRPWRRQNWMSGVLSTNIIPSLKISIWEQYVRCMQGPVQMRTCLVISGSWLQQEQQALSHLPQRHIMWLVVECPR